MSDSDSGSDLSDIEATSTLSPKLRFKPNERQSRLSSTSINSDDSDSDSDDSVMGGLKRLSRKRKLTKEAEKKKSSSDSDSDSDIDIDDTNSGNRKAKAAAKKKAPPPFPPATKPLPVLDLGDSDDSDDERARRLRIRATGANAPMSEALIKARKAREALAQNESIDFDDDDDIDDIIVDNPPSAAQKTQSQDQRRSAQDPSSTAQYVEINTKIKNGDPTKTHTYQLKINDAFGKLTKAHRQKHNYSMFSMVDLEYNGERIDSQKCPRDLGFQESRSYQIDICDEMQRIKQVRHLEASGAAASALASDRTLGEPGGIPLKIRRNGCNKSMDTFTLRPTSQFRVILNLFYQKYGVTEADCKFMFDGIVLGPGGTPEDEDLEGDEVIDVKVDEAALARGRERAAIPPPPPRATADSAVRAVRSIPSAPVGPTSDYRSDRQSSSTSATENHPLRPRNPLTVEVVRNNTRKKKFKVWPTDKVMKLKEGYIKYYGKKGCSSVKFYLRGSPIEDEDIISFETLEILPTDTIIAMENGRIL